MTLEKGKKLKENTSEIIWPISYILISLTILLVCSLGSLFWIRWRRRKAAERKRKEEESEWTKQKYETVRGLQDIAEQESIVAKCNKAKVVCLCLSLIGEMAALWNTDYPVVKCIPIGLRFFNVITDSIAEYRSRQISEEAIKLLQEDNVTFKSKRHQEKRDEYCSSLNEFRSGLGGVYFQFRRDGDLMKFFRDVVKVLQKWINKRHIEVNRFVSLIVNIGQIFGFDLSYYAMLTGAANMILDVIAMYQRVSDIRNGSRDETANKIREIASNLEEQTYTMD
ncbi:uncharacterized protein LOC117103245 [Anneissia japonica]|uniref:uncharacterized protein LOC117103245 n=1 Tax=Anneissia japonica TaxID=1529436 RepID=UPI00142596BF|nr:uncharacterized protein LOC117103245 [Anneissia japonica]XP_033099698.1 uncharacterized protein LOC117103245 [Anneissia japonica]